MSLIQLSPPTHRLPLDLLAAPGGFVWWYFDAVDAQGNGAVVIWAWGLPFLPGYASASRKGFPELPAARPSVNVVFYRDGKEDFYLLQEYAADRARWDGDSTWHLGDSRFHSYVEGDQRVLEIDLDLDVPAYAEKLRGSIRMQGPARQSASNESANPDHDWSPLAGPAQAWVSASHGDQKWEFSGRGYHDRNGGRVPMHDQGIREWIWGRIPFKGFERIFYLTWPHSGDPEFQGLDILNDGTTRQSQPLRVEIDHRQQSLAGPTYPRSIRLLHGDTIWMKIEVKHVLDEGPFYLRFMVDGHAEGQSARGISELMPPDKIDTNMMRPLVRMRIHQAQAKNSIWLPLFCGPKAGRVGRLLSSWVR